MNSMIVGMLSETSVHPGSGQDVGFVDLPVARETATDYPVVVGSSLKGALRDRARQAASSDIDRVFGGPDSAGQLLVGDGRLLLLPIRSLTGSYRWVTCSHLLERFARDTARSAGQASHLKAISVKKGQYAGPDVGILFLEERQFEHGGSVPDVVVKAAAALILHEDTAARVANRLVVLHDDDFAWFARYGLTVNARNVLDEVKKTSKNLWYEETIPPDSLFYCLLAERTEGALTTVSSLFADRPYLQVGGNETVGQGWFAVKLCVEGAK